MTAATEPAGPTLVVLGARGQVGHALARALAPLGRVRALGRDACDLERPEEAAAAIRALAPAAVVNASAYTAVDRAEAEAERAHVVNAEAPGALAAAAADVDAAFVHFSTDYVFDGRKPTPYDEGDLAAPLNVYGHTKHEGERRVAAANRAHLVFRTTWVYDPARGHNFVRTMRRLAAERPTLDVVDDQVGAPTYAVVLAAAVAQVVGAAVRAPEGASAWVAERAGVYHLSAGGSTTWRGFAEALFVADGSATAVRPIRTADYPTPAARPANSRLCCDRAAEVFGVRLPDWREQLRLALEP